MGTETSAARSVAARRARSSAIAILLAIVLLVGAMPAAPSVAETIDWVRFDLPPVFILEGALAGAGVGDLQQRFLQQSLPDFDHHSRQADISRLWYDIKNSPTICATDVYRNEEREKVALFSARAALVPNYRLVVLQSRSAEFQRFTDKSGALDLGLLAQAEGLKGAYMGARIYGGVVDRFLKEQTGRVTLDTVTKGQLLYNVLINKRVDFIFAAPSEVIYYKELAGAHEDIISFSIAGQSPFIKMYTACSRSALGERVIAEIDRILDSDQRWEDYIAPLKRWMDQADFDIARSHN